MNGVFSSKLLALSCKIMFVKYELLSYFIFICGIVSMLLPSHFVQQLLHQSMNQSF